LHAGVAIYQNRGSEFFEAITPEAMRWSTAGTRAMGDGWDLGSVVLADEVDDEAPVASLLRLPPGARLPRHAHDCHRMEVVVSGSINVGGGTVLGPGDVSVSRPGEFYGPHIAGPEGSLSVEIFSRTAGLPPIFDPDDEDAKVLGARVQAQIDAGRA
jgi:hypothetical protein